MGILKDKLNKLIGKKNPINSIPAVLGDLLGDIVDSVENNNNNTENNNNNGDYHIEIDSLNQITKIPINDTFIKFIAEFNGESIENTIILLEDVCKSFGMSSIQEASVFVFIMYFGYNDDSYKNPLKIKINKIEQLFGGKYVINDVIALYNISGDCLYGSLNIKDGYIAMILDTKYDPFNMYIVHNIEYETGVMLNPNIAGYENYFSIINGFNSFLNYKKVNYYARLGSYGSSTYFRIFGTDYFYESSLDRYTKLNTSTWQLDVTDWTLP